MKFPLLVALCLTLSLSASAQWWNISLKKHERFPALTVKDYSVARLPAAKLTACKIPVFKLALSDYSLERAQASIMKIAQHHMRFREYDEASYNFSDLAQLYVQENRLSEAKWYLLQSNNISRQQFDDKHTINNLMALAMIKANLGDLILAQQDLVEARQLAGARGWVNNVADIDKEIKVIQHYTASSPKAELRYADLMEPIKKVVVADKKTN